jgi:hypothetical protein
MNALRTGLIAAGLAVGAALSSCAVAPYGYYDGGDVGYFGGVYAPYGYDYGGWGGGYRVGPPRGGEHGGYRGVGGRPGGPGGPRGPGGGHGGGDHGGGSHGGGGHGGGAPGIPTGSRGGGHR